jgi:hypothetical protein
MASVKSFPRASFVRHFNDAESAIASVFGLPEVVYRNLRSVPKQHARVCLNAVAEAQATGMLAMAMSSVSTISSELSDRAIRKQQLRELKAHRSRIVQHCQAVGILPSGLTWFLLRWVVLPFLLQVLTQWTLGGEDVSEYFN